MIKLQLVSDISGRWDVYHVFTGWRAHHEDFDAADDSLDDRVFDSPIISKLASMIKQWESENEQD